MACCWVSERYLVFLGELVERGPKGKQSLLRVLDYLVVLQVHHHLHYALQTHGLQIYISAITAMLYYCILSHIQ